MALSGTGPIKMSQIKAELGSTSNSLRAYSAAAGKSTPDVMSEFFGYSSATTSAPTTAATTAAPTTAAPTTAATTAAPTTAATTAAPTTAATTAAPPPYSFLVTNGRANSSLACATTAKPNTLYSYDSDFDLANRFYSTNTHPYTPFDGEDRWFSNGIEAVQINTSGYPIDSITCPTTAAPTTAAPTTAAPTTAAPTTAAPTTAAPTTAAPTTAAPTTYTVNIWGRKSGGLTVLLYYGVNDVSCPNGGNTLSTTGALKHTIQVAYGGVVYVRCTDADDAAVAFNAQVATNTYGVATCPNPHYTAFTITENTDISVIGDARNSC
jgi:hypothetical protein